MPRRTNPTPLPPYSESVRPLLFYDALSLSLSLTQSLIVYGVHWAKGLGIIVAAAAAAGGGGTGRGGVVSPVPAKASSGSDDGDGSRDALFGGMLLGGRLPVPAAVAAVCAYLQRLDCEEVCRAAKITFPFSLTPLPSPLSHAPLPTDT